MTFPKWATGESFAHTSGLARDSIVTAEQTHDAYAQAGNSGEGKKVLIRSYGCQMNVYDAQRMGDVLEKEGYAETTALEDADLVILNTCHIREKAAEKIYSELGKLRMLKQERAQAGKTLSIAVAGCVAQAEGEEIIRRQPAVDIVVGPQNYHRLGELTSRLAAGAPSIDTGFPVESKFDFLAKPSHQRVAARGVSAFVTIQEGCDKFCAFCVVPYTRGAEVSRPAADILREVEHLAAGGVREVTIIGQNVNAYNVAGDEGERVTLAGLMDRISLIDNIKRIRYTTSHPRDMLDDLIMAHRDNPKVMPFLHLPVQAGSDRILAAMNRKHTAAEYLALIGKIRKFRPDIALSSDFIVGFPGETGEDFEATMALIREVRFASVYSFKYSKRPGTPAAQSLEQVPEDVMKDRLAQLQAVTEEHRQDFNRSMIGRTLDVLLEKPGRYGGQLNGKTPYLHTVQVDLPGEFIGSIVPVKITQASTNSLFGEFAGAPAGKDYANA